MNTRPEDEPTVYSVTNQILYSLERSLDTSIGKATLANLRNSIGKPLSETISIWPLVYEHLPKSFLSQTGKTTDEERAILTSLQLYALHQQGRSESVLLKNEQGHWNNMGSALKTLRQEGNPVAVDRRFNSLITSSSYEELVHHLRQMIQLLKSKTKSNVAYGRLAQDLFWYLKGYDESLRLRWARAYYSTYSKGDKSHE